MRMVPNARKGRCYGFLLFFAGVLLSDNLLAMEWVKSTFFSQSSSPKSLISQCRKLFPDVASNPSAKGGIGKLGDNNPKILCVYGSLEGIDFRIIEKMEPDTSEYVLILRSTGGSVATWLHLAEVISSNVSTVIVDEACFSSCANYAFVLGPRRIVEKGGLVVWHGGPVQNTPVIPNQADLKNEGQEMSLQREATYANLSNRTDALYKKLDIDLALLSSTAKSEFSAEAIKVGKELLGVETSSLNFVGYALPPVILSDCFGLTGLEDMWHPGSERETVSAGLKKSSKLLVALAPLSLETVCASRRR